MNITPTTQSGLFEQPGSYFFNALDYSGAAFYVNYKWLP